VSRKGYREREWGFLIALCAALYPILSYLKARLDTTPPSEVTLERGLLPAGGERERPSAQGDESEGRSATGVDAPSVVRD
jgi:hypothetical protein